jgi:O-antigen ligase/tetratricopeptide (TPR) repeat protein
MSAKKNYGSPGKSSKNNSNGGVTNTSSAYIRTISAVFLLAYWAIGFVPNLKAVDQIAPQWAVLHGLNILSILWMFSERSFFVPQWRTLTRIPLFGLLVAFMAWGALSFIYAINPVEAWVNIVRMVAMVVALGQVFALLGAIPRTAVFFSWVMAGYLTLEMWLVLKPLMGLLADGAYVSRSGVLKGTTGNINIAALSMVIKLPFVLYLMNRAQKWGRVLLMGVLMTLVIFCLVMIASRASFVALTLNAVIYMVWVLLRHRKQPWLVQLKPVLYVWVPFALAIGLSKVVNTQSETQNIDFFDRAATIVQTSQDGSIASRLRFYQKGVEHMIEHPIFGTGLGNWKLQSIVYDRKNINGYVVPYHMHNDFLELGAELGIVGLLMYLGVLALAFWYLWQAATSSLPSEQRFWGGFLALGLVTYYIDATFNFPWARPIMQMVWLTLLALAMQQWAQSARARLWRPTRIKAIFWPLAALLISIPSFVIAALTYQSLVGQQILLGEYNQGKTTSSIEKILDAVPDIPNMTVTTLPLVSLKGRYFMEAQRYEEAEQMYKAGIEVNPFLGFSENMLNQLYTKQQQWDSALKYSRIAYEKLPIPQHFGNYLNHLVRFKDSTEVMRIFLQDSVKRDEGAWRNFLVAATQVMSPGRSDLSVIAETAKNRYPDNKDFKVLHKLVVLGKARVDEAYATAQQGNALFGQGQYAAAAALLQKASALDPLEYSYVENTGAAYFSMGDWGRALPFFDQVILQFKPGTGKSEYIKALALINLGRKEEACALLDSSISLGYPEAQKAKERWCTP